MLERSGRENARQLKWQNKQDLKKIMHIEKLLFL
jgi:hypothetical protein